MKVIHADITKLESDAIVNAANSRLLGGGGVDGAIHRAAGKDLLEECRKLYRCETGDAKLTGAYDLPAKFIIHTVGPVWNGGKKSESELLESCYEKCCQIALDHPEIQSIAFPSISTGSYGFPFEPAANIAISTCRPFSEELDITFCCFSESEAEIYARILT